VHLTGSGARAAEAAAAAPTAVAAAAATAASIGSLARLATRGTTGRGVGESAGGIELLLSCGPKEIHAAIAAAKGLIYRHAPRTSDFSGDV
jgi:hypothetical protein